METKIEEKIREQNNDYCSNAYKVLKQLFEENPGKKMVFSREVGYRKITEIAPFGTFLGYRETPDGNWESYDSGEGAGHLMCKEHYIHGERWCDKTLEAWYACVPFWYELMQKIIYENELHKKFNSKDKDGKDEYITYEWVDNDMADKHWSLGC